MFIRKIFLIINFGKNCCLGGRPFTPLAGKKGRLSEKIFLIINFGKYPAGYFIQKLIASSRRKENTA